MRVTARIALVAALMASAVAAGRAQQRPQFRAGVEYVQVDVRVVDGRGEPIRDLVQSDFQIAEDGAPQPITAFSIVDLPLAPQAPRPPLAQTLGVRPDVATNVRPEATGRTFLIVFEAGLVAPCQTIVVRKALRQFVERSVGPDDLVGIVSTGLDRSFLNFTNDRARVLAVVDSLIGQAAPGPTVAPAEDISRRAERVIPTVNGADPPIGDVVMDDARQAFRRLMQLVQAMASAGDGSKAIILVTESIPFNMAVDPAAPLSGQGISLISEIERLSTTARRSNVPIYPIYPRGLTDGADCESDGGVFAAGSLLGEARQQEANIRALADDAGGVPIVGTNDLAAGLDRVAKLSSYYYVLGYNSSNNRGEGRYHKINVRVNRAGARVVARKGYLIPRASTPTALATLAGPPGSPVELREALNAVLPVPDLPMSMTAAAFRRPDGKGASAAVVIEALGAGFEWTPGGALTAPIELTAVALQRRGEIRTGEQTRLQVSQPPETAARIRNFGLRWIARLDDLKPGRYQIRGAISNGPARQGSAWYDIEIPDFSKAPLAMSDVAIASVIATQRITMRPDRLLADVLPAPPTAVRQFPPLDTIALYAEVYDNDPLAAQEIETSVVVISERGEEKSREVKTVMADKGVARIQVRLPLAALTPGRYTIAVEARQTANRAIATGRALPIQIVDAGNK
jgi:VWFA-related protein